MSNNGWTDDFLCTQWFKESFIPQSAVRNTSGEQILLIYDGYGSHTTDEMRKLAEENNIELFCLPPHTTHRTQPLDVGVFGPLQQRWQECCDEVLEETNEEIRKVDFIKEYMGAREKAFLPDTIAKSWAKTGICPLNLNIFTDADFAPSASTLRHARLPGSYPAGHDTDDSDFESGSNSDSDYTPSDGIDEIDSDHSDNEDDLGESGQEDDGENEAHSNQSADSQISESVSPRAVCQSEHFVQGHGRTHSTPNTPSIASHDHITSTFTPHHPKKSCRRL
jgi:hypothetical protein